MRIIIILLAMALLAMVVTAQGQTTFSNNVHEAVSSNNCTTIERLSKQTIKQSISQLRAVAKSDTQAILKNFVMTYTLIDVVEELNGIVEEQNKKITDLDRKIEALKVPEIQPSTNSWIFPLINDKGETNNIVIPESMFKSRLILLNSNAKKV